MTYTVTASLVGKFRCPNCKTAYVFNECQPGVSVDCFICSTPLHVGEVKNLPTEPAVFNQRKS